MAIGARVSMACPLRCNLSGIRIRSPGSCSCFVAAVVVGADKLPKNPAELRALLLRTRAELHQAPATPKHRDLEIEQLKLQLDKQRRNQFSRSISTTCPLQLLVHYVKYFT